MRVGHGYDIHRLQPGGTLKLCGVEVARNLSPIAHSDGDVALHALTDALLGALGRGDIGELFPDTDAMNANRDSRVFVREAIRLAAHDGFRVASADLTILTERPRLEAHKPHMRAALVELLQTQAVNVKAGTNEGCDAVGRGEAIACHALVLLADDKP